MLKKIILVTALLVAAVYYFANKSDTIASWHMINVNYGRLQGDANLLLIGKTVIMIDAGYAQEARTEVLPYLEKMGIKKIDHFFISHPHRDHYEGLAPIIDSGIPIINLYYKIPSPEVEDCCYDKKHFLKFINYAKDHGSNLFSPDTGFKLALGSAATIELLHAQEGNLPDQKVDVNDLSLIMRLTISNGSSVLFPGDLGKTVGAHLSVDKRMQAEFLKMPHHGLAAIAPNAFFETVNPRYVLVPGPKHLWCSERGDQARKWTASRNVPTWVNGINGHIVVEFEPDETIISSERAEGGCEMGDQPSSPGLMDDRNMGAL